jgi:hypothetical protein
MAGPVSQKKVKALFLLFIDFAIFFKMTVSLTLQSADIIAMKKYMTTLQ